MIISSVSWDISCSLRVSAPFGGHVRLMSQASRSAAAGESEQAVIRGMNRAAASWYQAGPRYETGGQPAV
jgi:hypothetical protein